MPSDDKLQILKDVFDIDWATATDDPKVAAEGTLANQRAMDVLKAWGRVTLPECREFLVPPPPELEESVELL